MSTRHDEFDDLLRVLDEAGCLSHVLIVGSWAEYLHESAGRSQATNAQSVR